MKTEDDTIASRRQFVSGVTARAGCGAGYPGVAVRPRLPAQERIRQSARAIQQTGPHYPIPASSLSPAAARTRRGLAGKMDPARTMAKRATGAPVSWSAGEGPCDRGRFRHRPRSDYRLCTGRRRCCDRLSAGEEPDAREVVELVRAEGRKAVAIPGDIRDERFCVKLVADAVQGWAGWISWSTTRRRR